MSQTTDSAACNAIDGFKSEIATAGTAHAALIAELEADLLSVSYGLSDSYMQFTDELAGDLGARAANQCERGADQDDAIATCESYVSDEVASDAVSLVSACVAFYGPEKAGEVIGKMVSESPVRNSLDVSP